MIIGFQNLILIYRKKTKRNDSTNLILYKQIIKDVENIYRDIAGFDMSSEDFKENYRLTIPD